MDFELRKQEEIIRRLEMEKYESKRERASYKTPEVTDFEVEVDRLEKYNSKGKRETKKRQKKSES